MRDIIIVLGLFILIPLILKRPHIGALVWTWVALLSPHREAFGFSSQLRPNLLIVLVTVVAFALSIEPKRWPGGKLAMSFVFFMGWTTLAVLMAPDPATSLEFYLDFVVKMALHMIIVLVLINSEHRLISLVWVFALSLGYHSVKIALVTIKSGFVIGQLNGFGPADTMIEDRNHFALAMLMLAPLLYFLWKHAQQKIMRYAAGLGMATCFIAVIGSFSRGGLITMAAMVGFLWTKTQNKIVTGGIMAIMAFIGLSFAPQEYKDRISTIFAQGQQETVFDDRTKIDSSFCGRLATWSYGWDMTVASPLVGHGLRSIQNEDIARNYMQYENPCTEDIEYKPRAAHNIYVEIMTDSGFVGLGLFVGILIGTWIACGRIAWRCGKHPDLLWARDLAQMIQVSLTGYAIGGTLLSFAYYSGYYILICMVIILSRLVDERIGQKPRRRQFHKDAIERAKHALKAANRGRGGIAS